jgi:superfamily I DNA/RNA helicase
VRLLESCPDVAEAVRSRYRWISVDEYQDLDERQYRLVRLMAPPNGNLCVIGDPDQAIYGFRGGDVSFFQRFAADFPSARVVTLTRNYRSSRAIVGAATQAIAPATLLPGRGLQAVWEGPERVVVHAAATDRAEAQFVVSAVERLIGGAAFFYMDSGRREPRGAEALGFSDFAVLYRTDAQADVLAEAFARSGMPFQKRSHALLGDMPCVRALLAALAGTPRDRPLAARLDLAEEGIGGFPADDTRQALRALQALAARAGDMEGFLTDLALGVDADFWDPRADAVSLLTLHSAKGLEFPVVFMTGCEDGVLPLRWGGGADVDVAEERRLMFVGMTRARERLFLSHARKRLWRGRLAQMRPSPFLADIERRLVERSATPARRPKPRAAEQLTLL